MAFGYQRPNDCECNEDLASPSPLLRDACGRCVKSSPRRPIGQDILYWVSAAVLIVWLLVVFLASCVILASKTGAIGQQISLLEDPTGNIPHCKSSLLPCASSSDSAVPIILHETKLQSQSQYTVNPQNATEDDLKAVESQWTSLLPVGQGFVAPKLRLDELPEVSMDPSGNPAYSVAVFHELHCLVPHCPLCSLPRRPR